MHNFFLTLFLGFSFFIIFSFVSASSPFDITFPVVELENCADQAACKVFCDDLSHKEACLVFAEKHGFASKEEIEKNKNLPPVGPGGCTTQEECRVYCDNSANTDECLAFAEKYGFQSREVSERAKLIKIQGGPGKCQSEKECRAYCENPSNQKECFEFAQKHGLIDKQEAKMIRKVMEEGGPGGCHSEEECRDYCENQDHFQECVEFGEKNGMISEEEAARIKRMPPVGPGSCRGEECRDYCENPDHQEECLKFAEENDLLPKEELERAKKMIGKTGPGGCRGHQCRDYCENPEHQEECLNFAIENNLIPKEEAERGMKFMKAAKEGGPGGCRGEECRDYCENEEHREECFEFAKDNGFIPEEELRRAEKGMSLSKKVKEIGGPGGCREEEKCREYCLDSSNVEECAAFAVEQGGFSLEEAKMMLKEFTGQHPDSRFKQPEDFRRFEEDRFRRFEEFRQLEDKFRSGSIMMSKGIPNEMSSGGFFAGPGGCKTPEECIKFCSDSINRDVCAIFNPSQGAVPPGTIFRQGDFHKGEGEFRKGDSSVCGSPAPMMPVISPCQGPVCKEGKWEIICPQGENRFNDFPMPSFSPIPFGDMNRLPEGVVCTQEYVPVCGTDNNTYPNNCYLKGKGIEAAYQGACRRAGEFIPPDLVPMMSSKFTPLIFPESSPLNSPIESPSPSGFNKVSKFLGNVIQGLLSIFE